MQQHGAPTRLLDWTTSAYVALYFAVCENFESDGSLWLFNVHDLHTKKNFEIRNQAEF